MSERERRAPAYIFDDPGAYCTVPNCWKKPTRPGVLCGTHFIFQMIGTALLAGSVVIAFFLALAVLWNTFFA